MNRKTEIRDNIIRIQERIAFAAQTAKRDSSEIQLMAVTKTVSFEDVNQAIDCGITLLGENKVQEYLQKCEAYTLPAEQVHFIGHLQSNKVKCIINKIGMVESVDSINLLNEIEKQAKKFAKTCDILFEVNVGEEDTKSGFLVSQIEGAIQYCDQLSHVNLRGFMCIPPVNMSEKYFPIMQELFLRYQSENRMDTLSMGMSDDYQLAIKYGATIVRVGSAMFGKRNYGGSEL